MFENVEAVFFDIDGTTVDVFPIHLQNYRNAFKKIADVDVQDPEFFPRLYSMGSDRSEWKKAWNCTESNPLPRPFNDC